MKGIKKNLLNIIAATLLVSVGYLISCKEVVGPIPEFNFEFEGFDTISYVFTDTSQILAGDPTDIVNGDVTNLNYNQVSEEEVNFLTDIANNLNSAFDAAQQSFWSSVSRSEILDGVSADDADLQTEIDEARVAYEANSLLRQYLPNSTDPSLRLINGRIVEVLQDVPIDELCNLSDQEKVSDCVASAQVKYLEVISTLEADYLTDSTNIEQRFISQQAILNDLILIATTAATDRNDERLDDFLASFISLEVRIEALSGLISDLEIDLLTQFNKSTYALSISPSYSVLRDELSLIASFQTDLDAQRTTSLSQAFNKLRNASNSATNALCSSINGCHNQGSSTGS